MGCLFFVSGWGWGGGGVDRQQNHSKPRNNRVPYEYVNMVDFKFSN